MAKRTKSDHTKEDQRPTGTFPTRDEFMRAMQAERDDHTPPPGTPKASFESGSLEHFSRWGTTRYGTTSRYGDGPEVRTVDKKAVARINRQREALAHRARLAAIEKRRQREVAKTRRVGTADIDAAVEKYCASKPRATTAELRDHLRRRFMKPGEKEATFYNRVLYAKKRHGKQK